MSSITLILLLICAIFTYNSLAQQVQLQVVRDPAGCVGGQVCTTQPRVAVVDLFGNILTNFNWCLPQN